MPVAEPSLAAALSVWQPEQRLAKMTAPRRTFSLSPRLALSSIFCSPQAATPAATATIETAEMAARRRVMSARNTNPDADAGSRPPALPRRHGPLRHGGRRGHRARRPGGRRDDHQRAGLAVAGPRPAGRVLRQRGPHAA